MKRIFKGFFVFLTFLISTTAFSQGFCDQKLGEAEDNFESGKFYGIPELLSPCLKNGFSREEKIRAYRLLTITFLYLEDQNSADKSYLELLKLSPEYEVNTDLDPGELIAHHAKFTTRPFVYLIAKGGVNLTHYNQIVDVSMNNTNDGSQTEKSLFGFNVAFGSEFTIYKNLHLGVEGMLHRKNFEITDKQFVLNGVTDSRITKLRQTYTELEFPLYIKYSFFKPKISPFVYAGAAPSILFLAGIKESQIQKGADISPQPDFDIYNLRNKVNYSLLGGFGIKYKIGINYLTVEFRHQRSMLNYSNEKDIWDSKSRLGKNLKYPSAYIDDFFRLSNTSILFGFVYPIYKPRKIKL